MATTVKRRKPTLKHRIEIAAFGLFQDMGINSVTVDAIAEAADTNKMGVYRNFGSKDALVEAWITDTIARYRGVLDELEFKLPDDPRGQLRGFAQHIADTLPAIADRGCPFVNTLAEVGDSQHPLSKRIIAHKKGQAERLAKLCSEANLESPEQAAAHLTFALEGAQVSSQNGSINEIAAKLMQVVDLITQE
ncbi:TetR/AcrR family transcriptional regulator [Marinibacterium sp. SX1]|uniref:TetR/AcrR family transcriptional regulator n=1 Tax=Marinibacterium sp. SX1 TaxID=3388424 RepID=UPI003D172E7C